MTSSSLFLVAVVGLLAGALARGVVGWRGSRFASLVVGLAGAVLGATAASALGLSLNGLPAFVAAALAGAAALLSMMTLVQRR
ncbi:MAG: GlsB/YeaQ/YmgE family stress response membrane protein [Pseudomonadota bacterium]